MIKIEIPVLIFIIITLLVVSCVEYNENFQSRHINRVRGIVELITKKSMVITSHIRTPENQARLMMGKPNLLSTYRNKSLIRELMPFIDSHNIPAAANTIRAQMNRGEFISNHLCGGAIDIRSRALEANVLHKLKNRLTNNGYYVIINKDHIHIRLYKCQK